MNESELLRKIETLKKIISIQENQIEDNKKYLEKLKKEMK